jgi:hypothetical protein
MDLTGEKADRARGRFPGKARAKEQEIARLSHFTTQPTVTARQSMPPDWARAVS